MDKWDQTYSGDRYLGLAMAGERMTAIGGFVFGPSGSGVHNVKVRIFKSPPRQRRGPLRRRLRLRGE